MGRATIEERISEYWDWVAVALFLLITVDMLTTIYATAVVGPVAESNPLVRWVLRQGPMAFAATNLVAAVLAVAFFYALVEMIRASPPPFDRYLALAVELWLGLLVAAGLAVFANNLLVIVYGGSLF